MTEQTYEDTKPCTIVPTVGGILSIISAGITLLLVFIPLITDYPNYGSIGAYFHVFFGMRIIWLITSTLAIIGGILAIKRRGWWLSLVGAIASILCIPMLMGTIATILVAVSKKEFR